MCRKLSQIMRFPMRPICCQNPNFLVWIDLTPCPSHSSQIFGQCKSSIFLFGRLQVFFVFFGTGVVFYCKLSSKQSRMVTIPGFPILPHPNVSRLTSHDCASPCLSEIDSPIMVPGDRLNFFRIFSAKPPAIPPYPAAPPYLNVLPSNHLTRVDSPIMHQAVQ